MKLALITDPKGLPVADIFRLSYHLVLAQYVRSDDKYSQYYQQRQQGGDFLIMDNGAAEDGVLKLHELKTAAQDIRPDEIVLPDVLADKEATIALTMDPNVLDFVPPKRRAVVPQGDNPSDWLVCANYFVENLDFVTMCVPKHTERFPGGRPALLNIIKKMRWHEYYNIHLLGIWDNPYTEVKAIVKEAPWVRGLDTALPFALAQHGIELSSEKIGHISHTWGRKFDRTLAFRNISTLMALMEGYE